MTYRTNSDGSLEYVGNKIFDPMSEVDAPNFIENVDSRPSELANEDYWEDIAVINDIIFQSTSNYFKSLGARYTLLPLTTRLISSPGAVFGSESIDYTEDTSPIQLNWFDLDKATFLSESSQIYLELALLQDELDHVFSIYNSFRKEPADETHLAEFHHIEYEGHVDQARNEEVAEELIKSILERLLQDGRDELSTFLTEDEIAELADLKDSPVQKISFERSLELLKEDTGEEKYEEFTEEHFGDWEEVRITEILDHDIVCIQEYPLLEVPFYHKETSRNSQGDCVAKNSDFIWPGYKETAGTGERVSDINEIREKAEVFNLPEEDYAPYIEAREHDTYRRTSGFGLGWERLLQGILKMPTITSVSHFPRVHTTLRP
jgi:aspartyl/asparaginyl-tRNA synthetase